MKHPLPFEERDPVDITRALRSVGYLPSPELAEAIATALTLDMPLLLEGEPGVGKTSLATALADALRGNLFRLQCYEGITAGQAIYDWDFRAQLIALRSRSDDGDLAADLYSERFLIRRKILRAFTPTDRPSVLLIDEIDRADSEFEAYLLEALSDGTISIPEMDEQPPTAMPVVVITSNRTRELHGALRRRCVYHWIDHPTPEHETQILLTALDEHGISPQLAGEVAELFASIRDVVDLDHTPGTSAAKDLGRAMLVTGHTRVSEPALRQLLGLLAKSRDDTERIAQVVSDSQRNKSDG